MRCSWSRRQMLAFMAGSAVLYPRAAIAQEIGRDGRWRADLDALAARIQTVHPNPYTRVTADSFRQEVTVLRERIPALMDRQVVLGFQRVLALLNDGHSVLNLLQAGTGMRRYPVVFRWFSDGLFISIAPEAMPRVVGSRVLAMNGKPVDAIYEAVRPWISYDTEPWYRNGTQAAFAMHDLLVAAEVVPEGAALALELEAADGQRFNAQVPLAAVATAEGPMSSRPRTPLYRRYPNLDYWFEFVPEQRTLYVQYNRCRENALLSIRRFADDLIAFGRENAPERWVIDVRENGGGNSIWFTRLVESLGFAVQTGQMPLPSKGAFGIISKRTFSSGVLAVRDMQDGGLVLIGETTGGRVYWFGENLPFVLPNSGLQLTVSTRLLGDPGQRPEVTPDVPVEFLGADYFADRDPYLETALRLDAALAAPQRASQFRRRFGL